MSRPLRIDVEGDGSWLLMASEYLHLSPVRTARMGLGKKENRAERRGCREPADEEVKARMNKLREYRWSSYGVYAGYVGKPAWLHTEVILARSGGKDKYRRYVQAHITRGADPEAFECLKGRLAIGAADFFEKAKRLDLLIKRCLKQMSDVGT